MKYPLAQRETSHRTGRNIKAGRQEVESLQSVLDVKNGCIRKSIRSFVQHQCYQRTSINGLWIISAVIGRAVVIA